MITYGEERRLGTKALIIFILQRTLPVVILIAIAFTAIANFPQLVESATNTLAIVNPNSHLTTMDVASWVANLISGLFFISIVLFIFGFVFAWFKYHFYTYTFEEFDMKLKKGILYRKEVTISYRQMQDINITRGIVFQIFGVSRILIDSGGHEEPYESNTTDIILEPIDQFEAKEIRDMLQKKIGVQMVREA